MKFEIRLEGHSTETHNYSAMIEVEADSNDEAVDKARDQAIAGSVSWEEDHGDYSSDSSVIVDKVEVESEIEE